jgi:hypothetical protein
MACSNLVERAADKRPQRGPPEPRRRYAAHRRLPGALVDIRLSGLVDITIVRHKDASSKQKTARRRSFCGADGDADQATRKAVSLRR